MKKRKGVVPHGKNIKGATHMNKDITEFPNSK